MTNEQTNSGKPTLEEMAQQLSAGWRGIWDI